MLSQISTAKRSLCSRRRRWLLSGSSFSSTTTSSSSSSIVFRASFIVNTLWIGLSAAVEICHVFFTGITFKVWRIIDFRCLESVIAHNDVVNAVVSATLRFRQARLHRLLQRHRQASTRTRDYSTDLALGTRPSRYGESSISGASSPSLLTMTSSTRLSLPLSDFGKLVFTGSSNGTVKNSLEFEVGICRLSNRPCYREGWRNGDRLSPRRYYCFLLFIAFFPNKKRPFADLLPIHVASIFSDLIPIGRDPGAEQRPLLSVLLPSLHPQERRPSFHQALCLSFRTTEEKLRNAFENFGQLVEVNLVMDRIANRPRGFAFLRYATEEESQKAIEGMHGKFLDGRVIFVEVAKLRSVLLQAVDRITAGVHNATLQFSDETRRRLAAQRKHTQTYTQYSKINAQVIIVIRNLIAVKDSSSFVFSFSSSQTHASPPSE
ncbi:cold-inducible RNA-binding protein isoform X2 [Canna indica]|uniref:Cold-inducible RNA-binding protein isoform X2 n=1 Tax=Canna indica TaxID=4628 RepID=A0AAQ3QFH8_9LILI|nr:cold-inducible RNA-binding protein isoform X2 [Canna indica]